MNEEPHPHPERISLHPDTVKALKKYYEPKPDEKMLLTSDELDRAEVRKEIEKIGRCPVQKSTCGHSSNDRHVVCWPCTVDKIIALFPDIEEAKKAISFWISAFGKFRSELRNILGENNIFSNLGWLDEEVLDGVRRIAKKAKEQEQKRIAEWGIEQCQEHYKGGGVISKRECPECWKTLIQGER